jgi:hypothetical protein
VLTCCAGLLALSFWALRRDFDWTWWLPNAYLMVWPVACLHSAVLRPAGTAAAPGAAPGTSGPAPR